MILNSFTTLASLFICCLGLYSGNSSYLDIAIIYFLLSFIAINGYLKYFINESNEKKQIDRHLSKFSYREEFVGDTKRNTAAYTSVCEDASIGSTHKLPLEVEFGKMSNTVILGCGLSGMLTALSFAQKGIKATIFESKSVKSPEF